MCSHYQALKERDKLARMLRVDPEELGRIPERDAPVDEAAHFMAAYPADRLETEFIK